MKLSEFIIYLQKQQELHGDVSLVSVTDTGRETYFDKIFPRLEYKKLYKGHPRKPEWVLSL